MAFGFGGFGGGGFGGGTSANANKDVELPQAPSEPISSVCWAPQQLAAQGKNFFAASSWDKTVRVWDIQRSGTAFAGNAVFMAQNDMPVFDCSMAADGRVFFGGGCCTAKMQPMGQAGAQPQTVAKHDLPVKGTRWIESKQLLATGGWDGKLKVWDCRQQNPAASVDLSAPYQDSDLVTTPYGDRLAVSTARGFIIIDINSMQIMKRMEPHYTMKEQIRCVGQFPDGSGIAAGGIDGRVCVLWFDQPPNVKDGKNFSFKCHREQADVYAVNGISFHAPTGSFATCGSDGHVVYWNKDTKSRVQTFQKCSNTIPCGKFDSTGQLYGYALSYDWSKGEQSYNPQKGHVLCLKECKPDHFRPKPGTATRK